MRCLPVVVLLAGCSFDPRSADSQPSRGGPPKPTPTPHGTCHVSDPSLELCLDFEDASLEPTTLDGSITHADAVTDHVSAMPRAGEQAMHVSAQSSVSAPLDGVGMPMTFEMFVNPDATPAFDESLAWTDSYALFHDHDGSVAVDFGGQMAWSSARALPAGAWTHVGFVVDDRLRLYVNGDVVACASVSDAVLVGVSDLMLADSPDGLQPFVGGIDNVRVFGRALSADDLCARAGRTKCKTACPE